MNVCLINPPFLKRFSRPQRSPGVIRSGTLYFPYWLSFAAGTLQQAGFTTLLLDAVAEDLDATAALRRVEEFGPDLVVVEGSTPSIASDLVFCAGLKRGKTSPLTVLVGAHASALWEQILSERPEVDFVAIGEYEITLKELARAIAEGDDPSTVPGLALRRENSVVATGKRALIEDLDKLPFVSSVYKQFLPIENYFFSLARHPMVMLITGRGCPNNCFFCVYPQTMHGRRYRRRSPENVVAELEYVREALPMVRDIVFEDDTFTANPGSVREICRLILERGLKLSWFANIRVDASFETLQIMRRAGLARCATGFETGSQETLGAIGKRATLEQALAFKKNCDRLGILVHGCFMFGFPGETRASLERTFAFAKKLNCDSAQFYPVFPYPGTEAYAWMEKNNYLRTRDFSRWLDENGRHACVYDLPGLSAEDMDAFAEQAYRGYYSSPRYLARKLLQCFVRPSEAKRNIVSGFNFFKGA